MSSVGVQSYQIRFRDRVSMHCQAGVENLDVAKKPRYMHICISFLHASRSSPSTGSLTVIRHYGEN